MRKITLVAVFVAFATAADAQGIYMQNGRATPSVIVGADGGVFPVIPGPHFAGPSPIVVAPPLAYASPRYTVPAPYERRSPYEGPPPLAYVPPDQPLSPPPLGWVFGRYTVCLDPPNCGSIVVSVGVDGINVRMAPNGPVVLALANGVPVIPLRREGDWLLVAAACPLVPTFTWSVTAGGIPLSVCP